VEPNEDAADGWVDRLMESARESTKATADGITTMAGDIAEVGGAVAKLADAVTRMAATCEQVKSDANDAKHAVTATDWFWRQVKSVLAKHRKAIASSMAVMMFGFGGGSTAVSDGVSPIGENLSAERLIQLGRYDQAERWIGQHWHEMGDAKSLWMMARLKNLEGESDAAMVLVHAAADAGNMDAAKLICSR
jgi:hypothetical protein